MKRSFTFGILKAFNNFCYGMDSGLLFKAVMRPNEIQVRMSFDGWLSHGQSCHILFMAFYKRFKNANNKMP